MASFFISVLEVVFAVIKSNQKKFEYEFLHTAYAAVFKSFDRFSKGSGLKSNTSKCKIGQIRGLRETNVALWHTVY